jgi:hypothetical protein
MKMTALAIVVLALLESCNWNPSPRDSMPTRQATPPPERDRVVPDDSNTITGATDVHSVAFLCKTTPNDRATMLLTAEMRRRTACGVDPTIQACRNATAALTDTTMAIRQFESGAAQVVSICAEQERQDALAREAALARRLNAERAAQAKQKRVDRWNECREWLGDAWATISAEDLCQRTYQSIPTQEVPIEQCIVKAKACKAVLAHPVH